MIDSENVPCGLNNLLMGALLQNPMYSRKKYPDKSPRAKYQRKNLIATSTQGWAKGAVGYRWNYSLHIDKHTTTYKAWFPYARNAIMESPDSRMFQQYVNASVFLVISWSVEKWVYNERV